MKSSQRQAIREVIDACRMHRKEVIRSMPPNDEDLANVAEGLDISATKLEAVIKEDDEVVLALKVAVDLIDQYEEQRKAVCGKSSVTRDLVANVLKRVSAG